MRFFRRLDPFIARDPDEMDLIMNRLPRKLVTGLMRGALMFVVAGLLTLGIAAWLQKNAQDKGMRLTAERNAQTGLPADPRALPSPGANPAPAETR
jgi:hypothetical protein